MFKEGDVVFAFVGRWRRGTINYRRMIQPECREVAAYSVLLDDQLVRAGYSGTVVTAALVFSPEQHARVTELEQVEKALNERGWTMEEDR